MEMENTVIQTVDACIQALHGLHDRGITFIDGSSAGRFLPYARLREDALRVLGHLQRRGLQPGDELVLQLSDNEQFIKIFCACVLGRIVPVPVAVMFTGEAMDKLLNIWSILRNPHLVAPAHTLLKAAPQLEARGTQVAGQMLGASIDLEALLEGGEDGVHIPAATSDLCYIQFSSGSTGTPKGVMLTHGNLMTNIHDMIVAGDVSREGLALTWLPLTHDMGLIGQFLRPMAIGLRLWIMSVWHFMKHPLDWMNWAARERITELCSPNFGYQYFLSALAAADPKPTWDLTSLRKIYNGAEPISLAVTEAFIAAMAPYGMAAEAVCPVYGLAEASLNVSQPPTGERYQVYHIDRYKLGIGDSVQYLGSADHELAATFFDTGYPVEHCEVRIADNEDQPLPADTVGHIHIRGANVCVGYYRDAQATAELFTAEGWCRTGDIGFLHQGRLCITGRAKEMIIIRGQNYFPSDLEDCLGVIPEAGPGKVAFCGFRNAQEGTESLVAFLAWKKPLRDFLPIVTQVKERINQALGLSVEEVIPIPAILRTTSGKVKRFAMLDMWQQGGFDKELDTLRSLAASGNTWLERLAQLPRPQAVDLIAQALLEEAQRLVPLDASAKTDRKSAYFSSGFDSLRLTRLQGAVEKRFAGIRVPVSLFFKYRNIPELTDHLYEETVVAMGGKRPAAHDPLLQQVALMSDEEIERLLAAEG